MKKIFNFALYDFANSAFTTIIITFIFATYFAKQIAPNPVLGQSYWGWTIGITGFLVAIIGPIIGSFADKKNRIVFFIRCFSLLCILFTSLLWFSKPSQSYLVYTLVIVGIANLFYELSLIFYNSLLKDISTSKNWVTPLGNLGLHIGSNYNFAEINDGDKDINYFFGLDIEFNPELSFILEYNAALNENNMTAKTIAINRGGYLNAAIRWTFVEHLHIEMDFNNLLFNEDQVDYFNRELKITYIEYF